MKLVWTDPSIEDLISIRDYIARDSESYAANLIEQFIMAAGRLAEFTRLGRVVPEARDENIREVLCENYRIIVVHGRRELNEMPG